MGCGGSKATQAVARPQQPQMTAAEEFEQIAAERRKRIEEENRQRAEEEKEISEKLYAEKEGLRIKSHFMIEQKSSCDNLLELLDKTDLDTIRTEETSLFIQKSAKLKVERNNADKIKRDWIIYNNFGAIPREDMELLADFFSKILALTSIANAPTEEDHQQEATPPPSAHQQMKRKSLTKEVIKNRKSLLLALNISTLVTEQSFHINDNNVHCYDLPSGLVTAGVAKAVFELYKKRGRLSETAVHKLLKMGYKSLKSKDNITQMEVGPSDSLTVVGDIHGQLQDLLYIIESGGMPSKTNKYLFNGDFVDRGEHGAEVVCLLLALHLAFPDSVMMNRGNHEDYAICVNYGFQMECIEKYDELTFGMFIEVFQQLPLFTIINSSIIVIHGGLFHCKDASLNELNKINRTGFTLQDLPEEGEQLDAVGRDHEVDFLKQLQRDALWSDPIDVTGNHESQRGAGVGFGPDITRQFLELNNLKMVVRSHECVNSGYEEPYSGSNSGMLCTIFSASDYSGGGNTAAYMVFKLYDDEVIGDKHTKFMGMTKSYAELAAERAATTAASPAEDASDVSLVNTAANDTAPEIDPRVTSRNEEEDNDSEEGTCSSKAAVLIEELHPAEEADDAAPSPAEQVRVLGGMKLGYTVRYYYMSMSEEGCHQYENLLAPRAPSGEDCLTRHDSSDTLVPDSVSYPTDEQRSDMKLVQVENGVTEAESVLNMEKAKANHGHVIFGATMTLFELIVRKKVELYEAFYDQDPTKEGAVTPHEWATVMSGVLQLYLRWHDIIHILVDESHYREASVDSPVAMIDYALFIESFTPDVCVLPTSVVVASRTASFNYGTNKSRENSFTATDIGLSQEALQSMINKQSQEKAAGIKVENPNSVSVALAEAIAAEKTVTFNEYSIPECVANILYSENFEKIVAGFRSIDTTNHGSISKEQFQEGCAAWNRKIMTAADDLRAAKKREDAAAQAAAADALSLETTPDTKNGKKEQVAQRRRSSAANVKQIDQIERLMKIMDINEAGKIDINEFFEMFRLSINCSLDYHGGDEEAFWSQFEQFRTSRIFENDTLSPSTRGRGRTFSNRDRYSSTHSIKRSLSGGDTFELYKGFSIHIDTNREKSTSIDEKAEKVGTSVEDVKVDIDMLAD